MSDHPTDLIHLACPRCGANLPTLGEVMECQYCGACILLRPSETTRQKVTAEQAGGKVVNGVLMKPFAYFDPQANLEAFSLLVPQGWQVSGGTKWVIERPAAPAQISLRLYNPQGPEAFEVFPTLYFTWMNNPLIQLTKPIGSLYFGFEVRQPIPARDALRQFVLPRFRKLPDLRIIDEGPAMELLQAINQTQPIRDDGTQTTRDSARVRLHYNLSQSELAEELSCITEYSRVAAGGMFGSGETIYWNVCYGTAFRAVPDTLESYADLYRAIFSSFKFNPAWIGLVQQVSQGLTSNTIRHIHQIGNISRQISRNADEMRASNLAGWQERSASYDRNAEKFSQTIRGVDPYYDPNTGKNVELPSGYGQAWSTPLGEYVLSDDPNFNPNIGSSQNWTPLTPTGNL